MEPAFKLPLVAHFDIDPLIQAQLDEVKRFLDRRRASADNRLQKPTNKKHLRTKKRPIRSKSSLTCCIDFLLVI